VTPGRIHRHNIKQIQSLRKICGGKRETEGERSLAKWLISAIINEPFWDHVIRVSLKDARLTVTGAAVAPTTRLPHLWAWE